MSKAFHLGTIAFFCFWQSLSIEGSTPERNGYRIQIKPTQWLLRDFQFSLERVKNKYCYGATLGYRPSFQQSGEVVGGSGLLGSYSIQNWNNGLYEAVTGELNGKIYPFDDFEFFIETVFFYRFWWFDKKMASYDNVENISLDFNGLRTERVHVFGLKCLVGFSTNFNSGSRFSCNLDVFGGLGFRYRNLWYHTQNLNSNGTFSEPTIQKMKYWVPSLQLGLKVGIQILKRKTEASEI